MRHDSCPDPSSGVPAPLHNDVRDDAPPPLEQDGHGRQSVPEVPSAHPVVSYEDVVRSLDGPRAVEAWCALAAQLECRPGWTFGITEDGAFPEWRFGSKLSAGVLGPLGDERRQFLVWAFNRRGGEAGRFAFETAEALGELLDDLEHRPSRASRRKRCATVGGDR